MRLEVCKNVEGSGDVGWLEGMKRLEHVFVRCCFRYLRGGIWDKRS